MFSVLIRDCECWEGTLKGSNHWGKPETGLHWEFWHSGIDEACKVQFDVMQWTELGLSDFWPGCPGNTHL